MTKKKTILKVCRNIVPMDVTVMIDSSNAMNSIGNYNEELTVVADLIRTSFRNEVLLSSSLVLYCGFFVFCVLCFVCFFFCMCVVFCGVLGNYCAFYMQRTHTYICTPNCKKKK